MIKASHRLHPRILGTQRPKLGVNPFDLGKGDRIMLI